VKETATTGMKGNGQSDEEWGERAARKPLQARIEFIGDFDVVEAKGINLSSGGICFEVGESLAFEMQFEADDGKHRHRAHLAWVEALPGGRYRLGFKFVPDQVESGA